MSRWFRWYEGTSEDGKFRVAARNARVTVRDVIALWTFILEDASSEKHRGICTRDEDFMSSILDFDDGVAERILSAMENLGMISVGHGAITVINWGKRQFETDTKDPTNAERQKRWRDNHRTSAKQDSNGTVTEEKRPDTEAETNTEEKESCRAPRFDASKFEEFWKEYPKRKGDNPKNPARKQFEAAVRQGADPNAIIAGVKKAKSRNSDKIGTEFIPQALKWLRDRRWEDYADIPEVPSGPLVPDGKAVEFFKMFAKWHPDYGPEPGRAGCRASPEDLQKYGYEVAA